MQLRERREPLGQPADDPERERQPERAGADRRLGRPADGDPDRERFLERPRVHAAIVERGTELARPRDALLVAHGEEQVELLGEEPVVVA